MLSQYKNAFIAKKAMSNLITCIVISVGISAFAWGVIFYRWWYFGETDKNITLLAVLFTVAATVFLLWVYVYTIAVVEDTLIIRTLFKTHVIYPDSITNVTPSNGPFFFIKYKKKGIEHKALLNWSTIRNDDSMRLSKELNRIWADVPAWKEFIKK
jgi:hypothetical protein